MSFSNKFAALEQKGGVFEALRFVMVGGAATAVDLTVTVLLVCFTALHENVITTAAFCTAFLVSYFGHRYFTFRKKGSVVAFLALALSTLLLRNVMVFLLISYVMRGIWPLIIAMAAVTVITYAVSKFGIFTDKNKKNQA